MKWAGWLVLVAVVVHGEPRRMTLDEAVALALKQNSVLRIARAKVREAERRSEQARSHFFPQLTTDANLWQVLERQRLEIPRGALGLYPQIGPIPGAAFGIPQGGNTLAFSSTRLGQPLTQLYRIREGYQVSLRDREIAQADVLRAENEIALRTHEAFFGLLITQRQRNAAQAAREAAAERLHEAQQGVKAGVVLEVRALGARAALLESRQAVLTAENTMSDLSLEFNELLGLPLETDLELVAPGPGGPVQGTAAEFVTVALASNPEIRSALQTVGKARHGVAAARAERIPDVSAFGQYTYQNAVPFLPRNNGVLGLALNWTVFDGGRKRAVIGEREAQLTQAEENLRRLRNRITIDVEKAYRKVNRSQQLVEVAREAVALWRESERIAADQFDVGVLVNAGYREAQAARSKSEADLLQAELGYRLAVAELERIVGASAPPSAADAQTGR